MNAEKLRLIGERIGAMSLRERMFIFAAAVVIVFALVQTLLIDSGQLRQQRAHERLQGIGSTIEQLVQQQQLLASHAGDDPDQGARDALALQQARLAELSAELETRGRSLVPPERMHAVLRSVVNEQGPLRIVGFKSLGAQAVSLAGAAGERPPEFYRHGFEISVSGRYPELVAYLERLEALPWKLNWIEATLDAANRPDLTLTLVVHTLSLEEAWVRL